MPSILAAPLQFLLLEVDGLGIISLPKLILTAFENSRRSYPAPMSQ
jgi:hypothetical protein